MNPPPVPALRDGRPFRAVMAGRTAAWQCAVIPRGPGLACVMSLFCAPDGLSARTERVLPRFRAFAPDSNGGFDLGGRGFRLRLKRDKNAWYLSGSAEDRDARTWLWDIRLDSPRGPADAPLYRAAGRVAAPDGEVLFPPAASFLAWENGPALPDLALWAPPLALRTGTADAADVLPPPEAVVRTAGGYACRFSDARPGLVLEPWPGQPDGLFRLSLTRGVRADTRFGLWRGAGPQASGPAPGFLTVAY